MDVDYLIRREGIRRRLSPRTVNTYCSCVKKFLFRFRNKKVEEITKKDVESFLYHLSRRNVAGNTINVYLHSLRFFFEVVLRKKLTVNIKISKTPQRLPQFLSQEEVTKLFSVITNEKHQLIVKLLYATGMRISELLNLKVKDFEFDKNYGWVRQGKGSKDRLFIIATKLKDELLNWINKNHLSNNSLLFSGQGGNQYSATSVRMILKNATKKAKIKKKVHPHMLRHSFATHLIENGYAVTELQPLLGHRNLETTMIYLHMASPNLLKVKSPYDNLKC